MNEMHIEESSSRGPSSSPHNIANAIPPKSHVRFILGQVRLGVIFLWWVSYNIFLRWDNFINAMPNDPVVKYATSKYKLHLGLVCVERFIV
jgi:hypothetical protein